MPSALIFHPSQEILLAGAQKELLRAANLGGTVCFPLFPLYCVLRSPELGGKPPAELKKVIRAAEIGFPVRKDALIVFPVRIVTADGTAITEEIRAARRAGERPRPTESRAAAPSVTEAAPSFPRGARASAAPPRAAADPVLPPEFAGRFPVKCRVLRAAEIEIGGGAWSVYESVWLDTAASP